MWHDVIETVPSPVGDGAIIPASGFRSEAGTPLIFTGTDREQRRTFSDVRLAAHPDTSYRIETIMDVSSC